jgi:hypothetical protein
MLLNISQMKRRLISTSLFFKIRFRWWLLRNYILEICILLIYLISILLNELFYLRYQRSVIASFFDRPYNSPYELFAKSCTGCTARGLWHFLGKNVPLRRINEIRLKAITFFLMLATYLKNRFYGVDQTRIYRIRRTAEFFVLLGFGIIFYFVFLILSKIFSK